MMDRHYRRALTALALAVFIAAQGLGHSLTADAEPAQITWTSAECDADAACVVADGSKLRGSADLRAQGFLHGLTSTTDAARVEALKPQHWRLADEATYDLARAHGARITWVISDSWWQATCENGQTRCPMPPWQNWELYDSFVRSLVLQSIGSNRPVDYWDVVNEPPSKQTGSGTPEQYYEQLRHAHDAIRTVDPDAKIVAPSLTTYADVLPPEGHRSSKRNLELKTFLDFAVANNLRFDAISWHENTGNPEEPFPTRRPSDIVGHVAQARALLTKYPALGPVEIHINEYSPLRSRNIPGWVTGWIAGLEDADVDASMRTCWAENEPGKAKYTGCRPFGMLDGLLERDERTPRPAYWVYESYADMTGDRLRTSTNDPTVSVFATTDDAARQMRLLVGRHERCTAATNPDCIHTETLPTRSIDVRLRLPWQRVARAEVRKITNQAGSMPEAPPVVTSVEHGPDSWTTIHLPDVVDGDAYAIIVRPIA